MLAHCPALPRLLRRESMERLPTETALTETTRHFKQITRDRQGGGDRQ